MGLIFGNLPTNKIAGARDAFHAPAILVYSDTPLYPGSSVRFVDDSLTKVVESESSNRHAVIDPFLAKVPMKSLCWAILDPSKVSNLTHSFDVKIDDIQQPEPPVPPPAEIPEPNYDPYTHDDDDQGCGNC